MLWIRIQIGSVFRNFVDPYQYSEYGPIQKKKIYIYTNRSKSSKIDGKNSPYLDSID